MTVRRWSGGKGFIVVYAMMGWDDDEKSIFDWIIDWAGESVAMIPGAERFVKWVGGAFSDRDEWAFPVETPLAGTVNDAREAANQIRDGIKALATGEKYGSGIRTGQPKGSRELRKGLVGLAEFAGRVAGWPVEGAVEVGEIVEREITGGDASYDQMWKAAKAGDMRNARLLLKQLIEMGKRGRNIRASAKARGISEDIKQQILNAYDEETEEK